MDDVVALNRKPIPLRSILRVEERRNITTLAALRRAITEEIAQNQAQIEELERREAATILKFAADQDFFDEYLENRENQLHVYQRAIDQIFDELFELQRRTNPLAEKRKKYLRRKLGAYKGLVAQYHQRDDEPEQIRCEINDATDQKLEALESLKAPRRKRTAELLRRLESVEAAIGIHGGRCLLNDLELQGS